VTVLEDLAPPAKVEVRPRGVSRREAWQRRLPLLPCVQDDANQHRAAQQKRDLGRVPTAELGANSHSPNGFARERPGCLVPHLPLGLGRRRSLGGPPPQVAGKTRATNCRSRLVEAVVTRPQSSSSLILEVIHSRIEAKRNLPLAMCSMMKFCASCGSTSR